MGSPPMVLNQSCAPIVCEMPYRSGAHNVQFLRNCEGSRRITKRKQAGAVRLPVLCELWEWQRCNRKSDVCACGASDVSRKRQMMLLATLAVMRCVPFHLPKANITRRRSRLYIIWQSQTSRSAQAEHIIQKNASRRFFVSGPSRALNPDLRPFIKFHSAVLAQIVPFPLRENEKVRARKMGQSERVDHQGL